MSVLKKNVYSDLVISPLGFFDLRIKVEVTNAFILIHTGLNMNGKCLFTRSSHSFV